MKLPLMVHAAVVIRGLNLTQLLVSSVRTFEKDQTVVFVPAEDFIHIRELDLVKTAASILKIPLLLAGCKNSHFFIGGIDEKPSVSCGDQKSVLSGLDEPHIARIKVLRIDDEGCAGITFSERAICSFVDDQIETKGHR